MKSQIRCLGTHESADSGSLMSNDIGGASGRSPDVSGMTETSNMTRTSTAGAFALARVGVRLMRETFAGPGAWMGGRIVASRARGSSLVSLVFLVLLSLSVGACGYDPDQNETPTATPTATPVPTAPPTPTEPPTPTPCPDQDDDGACDAVDCAPEDPTLQTSSPEKCDGKDNDCDGNVPTDEVDHDGDGVSVCKGDCDDNDPSRAPGKAEACNGKDDNCDGSPASNESDSDLDGALNCLEESSCADGAEFNINIYPGAPELCDGDDNNCDGSTDEGFDLDDDGHNDAIACAAVGGDDCDDTLANVYPGAPEVCDSVDEDEDCDALADNADTGVQGTFPLYPDSDDDGFGATSGSMPSCDPREGYVDNSTDCNDTASAINPAAEEVCDSLDNDCDKATDEGFDVDQDGYTVCASATKGPDCDDTRNDVYPGAAEKCNGRDDDCSGAPDSSENDNDADGFLNCEESRSGCADDKDRNPKVVEVCDAKDNNCDGAVDEGFPDGTADSDADGIRNCLDDCPRWADGGALTSEADGSWAHPWTKIQFALDATNAGSCTQIMVRPGTYKENIRFNGHNVQLAAWNGSNTTNQVTIDGGRKGPTVVFDQLETKAAVLQGFNIVNGNGDDGSTAGTGNDLPHCGGGVRIVNASPTLKSNTVMNNVASSGAGICVLGGAPEIGSKMLITENDAVIAGGGVYLDNSTSAVLYSIDADVEISNNTAVKGGGLYCGNFTRGANDGRIQQVKILSNIATGSSGLGGGLYLTNECVGGITLYKVESNQADVGGGLYVQSGDTSTLTISGGAISSNLATYGGGVAISGAGGALLDQSQLKSNSATIGGGVYVMSSSAATIRRGNLTTNDVTQHGGGIYAAAGSKLILEDGIIESNTADGNGGGIYATSSVLTVNIKSDSAVSVRANTANGEGGGLYMLSIGSASSLSFVTFDSNSGATGGGVLADSSNPTFKQNRIQNNQASSSNGVDGVLCKGTPLMKFTGGLNVVVQDTTSGCQ